MRRVIATIFVFLLLGVIMSHCVAGACALVMPWPISVERHLVSQAGSYAWPDVVPDRWPDSPHRLRRSGRTWTITRYLRLEHEYAPDGQITQAKTFLIDQYAFGWPLRVVQSEIWNEYILDPDVPTITNKYEDHPEMSVWRTGYVVEVGFGLLPVRPIWPGFLINTLFYAAILWLIFAAPFALRRTIRRRRSCCPACGYPVGVSPHCTECGAAVAPNASTSAQPLK